LDAVKGATSSRFLEVLEEQCYFPCSIHAVLTHHLEPVSCMG
jgi:hypothetical protein